MPSPWNTSRPSASETEPRVLQRRGDAKGCATEAVRRPRGRYFPALAGALGAGFASGLADGVVAVSGFFT